MSYWEYPKYVSVAEKKAKAEKKLRQLMKKHPGIQPVVIEGSALAGTWWGKAWNQNLEKYADYANRIGRGRSYVRHGAVLDLQVAPGEVGALVQGSASSPYVVKVKIKPIPPAHWREMKQASRGRLDSLKQLLAGKFPKDLDALFTRKGAGLFPSPEEIDFSCSCPDWAYMCKHVAAVLYGIGARLDKDPGLFFTLRQVDVSDLISQAVLETKMDFLEKAGKKTHRVLESDSLSDLFGIDLGDAESIAVSQPANTTDGASSTAKTPPARVAKPAETPGLKSKAGKKRPIKPVVSKPTASRKTRRTQTTSGPATPPDDQVLACIRQYKNGVRVAHVIADTGLEPTKVRNAIVRLMAKHRIQNVAWGIYKAV